MSRDIVFMYSGQGAQYYQMGRELWERDPAYRAALQRYSTLAGPVGGRELTEILFSRPLADSGNFDRLAETHPLILAVSLALTDALAARGVRPDRLLGYSLGETIAAVVAGALTPEEAFWAVRAQASVFERKAEPGRLVAVLASADSLDDVIPESLRGRVHRAASNAPNHVVVGLAEAETAALTSVFEAGDIPHAVLPIRFAFHTPLIEIAESAFRDIADQLSFRSPRIPVYSCATAEPIETFDADHFWAVARGRVRFADTIASLASQSEPTLVDVGPSGTLAGFVRLAKTVSAPRSCLLVMNQFGRDISTMEHVVETLS